MSAAKAITYRVSADRTGPAQIMRRGTGGTVTDTPVGPVYCSPEAACLAIIRTAAAQRANMIGHPFIVASVRGETDAWNFEAALPADPCEHRSMIEHAMTPTMQPFDVPDDCDDAGDVDYDETENCDDAADVLYWECNDCHRQWKARRAGDMPAMLADIATARRNLAGQP